MLTRFPFFQWLAAKGATLDRRPFMSVPGKIVLLPMPFAVATGMSSIFWNIGQITNWQFLGGLTAVLAYPLILIVLLLRLTLPIHYRPLLSLRQKLAAIPFLLASLSLAGWLWVTLADQGGRIRNEWDLSWWCGVISMLCMSLAFL